MTQDLWIRRSQTTDAAIEIPVQIRSANAHSAQPDQNFARTWISRHWHFVQFERARRYQLNGFHRAACQYNARGLARLIDHFRGEHQDQRVVGVIDIGFAHDDFLALANVDAGLDLSLLELPLTSALLDRDAQTQ